MSWRQAKEYHRYQISELAATAAHWQRIGKTNVGGTATGTAVTGSSSTVVDNSVGVGVDAES